MGRLSRVVGKAEVGSLRTWLVPLAAVIVVALAGVGVWALWPSPPQYNWQRYLRAEADYSIDMPGTPETTLEAQETEFGPTTMQTTQFVMKKPSVIFAVHYSPFPSNSPFQKMTRGQAEASLERFVSLLVGQLDGKLLGQNALTMKGGTAREFRIETGGRVYYGRMLYTATAQYQIVVLAPQEAETPEYVTKFFKSFDYRGNPT